METTEKLTYEQQAGRIARLEKKLVHVMEKEAHLAVRVAELEDAASKGEDFAVGVDTTYMDKLGAKLYGETWPTVRAHNIKRMKGDDPSPLGQKECQTLVNGLRKLDEMRRR